MPQQRLGDLRLFASDLVHFAKADAVGAILLVLAGAFLEGIGLLMLVPLFSIIVGPTSGGAIVDGLTGALLSYIPAQQAIGRLMFVLAIFALIMALRAFVLFHRDVLLTRLQVGFVQERRSRVIRLLASSRWDFVARIRHGRVAHVLGSDAQSLRTAAHNLIQCAVAAAILGAQALFAVLVSPMLALVILVMLAGGGLALRPFLRRSQQTGADLTEANLEMVNSTGQFLGGLKLALSQNLQTSYIKEFDATQARALDKEVSFARQRAITQIALTIFTALLAGLVLLIDAAFLGTSPAALIVLLVILVRTSGPATQIQQGAQHIFHALPAYAQIRRLEDELQAAQRQEPANGAAAWPLASAAIEFRRVSFWHNERAREPGSLSGGVFELDLRVEEGSVIGLTGPSGAGKTTFADLLVGLYPPKLGSILIGGEPLADGRLNAWRDSIAYVSQDPFLFHDSVRNNLLWARPDADEDKLWERLACVEADRLVRDLDGGLDATVGERGGLLSGGERQRIALARALLRDPRLLLLDEATNAIDADGEARIFRALLGLPRRPTIVMIAHREASFVNVERVIRLSEGRIVSDRPPGSAYG